MQQYLPLAVLKPFVPAVCHGASNYGLQQYLPLAVLKHKRGIQCRGILPVATVPTACGIETYDGFYEEDKNIGEVATVPTACGIETVFLITTSPETVRPVATVPTACGIETDKILFFHDFLLQEMLQQYLPLAVLKQDKKIGVLIWSPSPVATVPTACGIETDCEIPGNKTYLEKVATVPTACGIETY